MGDVNKVTPIDKSSTILTILLAFPYFAEVLPDYDRDRVHVSDMKKCFSWYNTLVKAGFTEFKLPEQAQPEAEE